MEAGDLSISQIYGIMYYFQVIFEHFRVLGRGSSRGIFVSYSFNYDSFVSSSRKTGGHPSLNGDTKVGLPFLYRKSHFSAPSAMVL